jgi:DNA polymerase epsilon subunit 2
MLRRAPHQSSSVLGTAESRILAIRDRLNIIKQTILRNEHFAPSTIPSRDREHLLTVSLSPLFFPCDAERFPQAEIQKLRTCRFTLQLKSTKQLLGRAGDRFLLFGMLVHSKEGKLCLEDLDGVVELDFSQLVRAHFFHFVLALGPAHAAT